MVMLRMVTMVCWERYESIHVSRASTDKIRSDGSIEHVR